MTYSGGRQGRGGRGGRGGGGRGAYYKNKYGRGGRGGADRSPYDGGRDNRQPQNYQQPKAGTFQDLCHLLQRIDGKQYPAYHDIETSTALGGAGWIHPSGFTLQVGRTQSDPFAPPTRTRVFLHSDTARLPATLLKNKLRRVAASDYLLRQLYNACRRMGADQSMRQGGGGGWSGPKGGDLQIMAPCQHVLEQTAVRIDEQGNIAIQLTINLPARGRTVLGQAAERILGTVLVDLLQSTCLPAALDIKAIVAHVDCIEDQAHVLSQVQSKGLIAFVPNGAVLPRMSGVDDRPMGSDPQSMNADNDIVKFKSPPSLECEFALPNTGGTIRGMGIPKGVTLICGGGFHGKSTLLQALQVGVYFKVPGDGREFCLAAPSAMKIRAEDGRSINEVDISSFIKNLPFGKDTTSFCTADASGSTSQASNIVESIEMGADVLLLDEDTCAQNAMVRDQKMVQLVAKEKEPITPFISVVRSLYTDHGVSTIMVVGGAGDFFEVADRVLLIDCYECQDATLRVKEIVLANNGIALPATTPFDYPRKRCAIASEIGSNGKVKVISKSSVSYGETELELGGLEQIVSLAQTSAITMALQTIAKTNENNTTLKDLLGKVNDTFEREGLDFLAPGQLHGQLARPRTLEISGALNRLRRPCIRQEK